MNVHHLTVAAVAALLFASSAVATNTTQIGKMSKQPTTAAMTTTQTTRFPPDPYSQGKCPKGWTYEVPPPHRDPQSGLPTGKRQHKPAGICVRSK